MPKIDIQLPAQLISAGQFVAKQGFVHTKRKLDSSVLILMEAGCFTIQVESQRYTLQSHQAIFLPAGQLHYGIRMAQDIAPKYYWAHFMNCEVYYPKQRIELDTYLPFIPEQTYLRAVSLYHQLFSEKADGRERLLVRDYLLSLLLAEIADTEKVDNRTALFNRMNEYIRLHCREELTLAILSKELGYSEDYLSRLFHANVHCSFRQYIHSLRLEQAKQELLTTTKTIQEIALDCGYTNAKFFSTVFSKSIGVRPSSYRNLYGGLHQNDH